MIDEHMQQLSEMENKLNGWEGQVMSDIIGYEVVMFQGEEDGVSIFGSSDVKECKTFAKKGRKQFKTFVENGFPVESLPEFAIIAYHTDQITSFVEDEQE
jgi:hypothetical protein